MSGTDKTKTPVQVTGPAIVLVEPQLADNIGAAARAMANFSLSRGCASSIRAKAGRLSAPM